MLMLASLTLTIKTFFLMQKLSSPTQSSQLLISITVQTILFSIRCRLKKPPCLCSLFGVRSAKLVSVIPSTFGIDQKLDAKKTNKDGLLPLLVPSCAIIGAPIGAAHQPSVISVTDVPEKRITELRAVLKVRKKVPFTPYKPDL